MNALSDHEFPPNFLDPIDQKTRTMNPHSSSSMEIHCAPPTDSRLPSRSAPSTGSTRRSRPSCHWRCPCPCRTRMSISPIRSRPRSIRPVSNSGADSSGSSSRRTITNWSCTAARPRRCRDPAAGETPRGVEIVSCRNDGCQDRVARPLDHQIGAPTGDRQEKYDIIACGWGRPAVNLQSTASLAPVELALISSPFPPRAL
jgi:hypothetical protein